MTCRTCCYWDKEQKICYMGGSKWGGKHREAEEPACAVYKDDPEAEEPQLVTVSREAGSALMENVDRMGKYILQLGQLVNSMQRRMDEMEKQQAAVTIRHEDVKRLQALIRMRAEQICGKYELKDKDSPRIFRAAIKKDVLKRSGAKDLHDVPAAQLAGIENMVNGWTNIRLTMERRAKA